MAKITFAELFGTAIQNALHVRKSVPLAFGESMDVEIRLPKDGEGEFAMSANVTANIVTYAFFGGLFEVFNAVGEAITTTDKEDNVISKVHNMISFYINWTGVEPERYGGYVREDGNVYGANDTPKFHLLPGSMLTIRITNTKHTDSLPLRTTSVHGINVPLPQTEKEAELSARLDMLERAVFGSK